MHSSEGVEFSVRQIDRQNTGDSRPEHNNNLAIQILSVSGVTGLDSQSMSISCFDCSEPHTEAKR